MKEDCFKKIFLASALAFVLFSPSPTKAGDCYTPELAKGLSQESFLQGHCQPQSICDLAAKEDAKTQCLQSTECAQKYPTKPVCMLVGAGAMSTTKSAAASPASVSNQQKASAAEDRNLAVPKLNVKIPGLVFESEAKVVKCDGALKCISIPFLAQYIAAFYKIIFGVGLIATALMIVYGGFLYVLGSTGIQIKEAKQKITDALIGMAILVGAYTILVNINPQSMSLKGLEIQSVPLQEQQFLDMTQNQTTPTVGEDFIPLPGEACPLIATKENQSNKVKYFNGILATVKSGTYVERLKKVGDIVTGCNVNLTDCGHTAMAVMALAGIGETDCLTDDRKICWSFKEYSKNITGIYQSKNSSYLTGLHKNGNCKNVQTTWMESDRKPQPQAVAKARELLQSWEENYPDSVADMLQPGDFLWTYTANNECNGLHSSIFMGWNKASGKAKILEGDVKNNPRYTERCLKKSCGNFSPIVRIMRPKLSRMR